MKSPLAAIPPRNAAFALGVGALLVLLTLATSGAAPKVLLLPKGTHISTIPYYFTVRGWGGRVVGAYVSDGPVLAMIYPAGHETFFNLPFMKSWPCGGTLDRTLQPGEWVLWFITANAFTNLTATQTIRVLPGGGGAVAGYGTATPCIG